MLFFSTIQISYSKEISEDYIVASNLNIADGLQSQDINDIFFDDKGFAWIGTFGGGVSKYDGETFINFSTRTSPSIKSDYINDITQDNFNRLWIAGNNGVDVIDLTTMKTWQFPDELSTIFSNAIVSSISRSSDGCIWYNTNSTIVRVSFSEDGNECYPDILHHEGSAEGISHILFDVENDGSMWFAKNGTLHKIITDTQGNLCVINVLPYINLGEFNAVTAFLKRDYLLWIGTERGLCRINLQSGECLKYWNHSYPGNGVWNNEVTSLCASQDGKIFVGTLSGVFVYDNHSNSFSELSSQPNKYGNSALMGNLVRDVVCQNSNIWIGQEVKGLTILKKKNLPIVNFSGSGSAQERIPDAPARAVFSDSKGQLWLASTKNGVFLKSPLKDNDFSIQKFSSASLQNITAFCEDGDGRVWFGNASGEIGYFGINSHNFTVSPSSRNSEICRNLIDIFQMVYDKINNSIWLLTRMGLYVYDIRKDSFSIYSDSVSFCLGGYIDEDSNLWISHAKGLMIIDLKSLTDRSFTGAPMSFSIIPSGDDLWFGSFDRGVWKISKDVSDGIVVEKQYTIQDGLCDNRTRGMALVNGVLWITTENGLSRLDINSQELTSYGIHDGLASTAFCENSIAVEKSGIVYLGRKEGLSWIEPSYIFRNADQESKIIISSFIANGVQENLVYRNTVEANERDKDLTIIFSDLSYNASGIQYQSRIDFQDGLWSPIYGNRKIVRLGKVPFGNHKIEIRAINAFGTELSKAVLNLNVKPHFYKTWWFILLIVIMLFCVVWSIIQWRTFAISKKKEQLQQEIDKKTKILLEQKVLIQNELDKLAEQNRILLKQNELLAGSKLLTSNDKPNENTKFMKKAMSTLRRMYKDSELDVDTFSEEMGMSRSVLNERIHEAIGLSISQFIRDYRLNVAKEMISNGIKSDKNISEIAYEVGFNDPKYFTRCFSKKFGVAPTEIYKERHSEKEGD